MDVQTLRSSEEIRKERLSTDPAFRAYWEQTALARAVALAVVGYRARHKLSQTQLASMLGARQPQVARLELGDHTPTIEMLQQLSLVLGLRFIVEVVPTGKGAPLGSITLPEGVEVVEDVSSDNQRVLIAAG